MFTFLYHILQKIGTILISFKCPLSLVINMSTDAERLAKEKEFLKKHPPASPAVVQKTEEEMAREQEQYREMINVSASVIEANLTDFLSITDPLIIDGKVIVKVKRPSMKTLKTLFPLDMLEDAENIDAIALQDPEKAERYDKALYGAMAKLIAVPKHTAEEWHELANKQFIQAFFGHIASIGEDLQGKMKGF